MVSGDKSIFGLLNSLEVYMVAVGESIIDVQCNEP
jgi:hypothetical protein